MPRIASHRLRIASMLTGFAILVVGLLGGAQRPDDLQPDIQDKLTTRLVGLLLSQLHLDKPSIDDELSQKWFASYLEGLDPSKFYFTQGDIDQFEEWKLRLDEAINSGDLTFATQVFTRYLTRSEERLALVMELLEGPFDYTVDEYIIDDPDQLTNPTDEQEIRDRWRKRIKLDLLQLTSSGVDQAEAIDRLKTRYTDRDRFFHQFDMFELMEVYLTSLTTAIDPHSEYLGPRTWEDMRDQSLQLNFEGIGARLRSEGGYAVVEDVIPGGAADKDGTLAPEDKIVAVETDEGQVVEFFEMKLKDVVTYIKGPKGTTVKLFIVPAQSEERQRLDLVREKIDLVDQRAKGRIYDRKADNGQEIKVGVIEVPTFYGNTLAVMNNDPEAVSVTIDCQQILADFQDKGVDIVLIDLQRNGGGLLSEAISLSGLFIDEGPVVQVRDARRTQHYDDDQRGTAWDGPVAVLIDRTTASASEIFAGVIRDYGRGLILGDEQTYGKGTVQSIVPINEQLRNTQLPDMGVLKLTIQQFYRANGESTQVEGVKPHIVLPTELAAIEIGEGTLDNAVDFDEIPPLARDAFNRVPLTLVDQLTQRSVARRAEDPEFQKQEARRKLVRELRERKRIPLQLEKYQQRIEALQDEEDRGKTDAERRREAREKARQTWPLNFYREEVLDILADYVVLGGDALASRPVPAEARR